MVLYYLAHTHVQGPNNGSCGLFRPVAQAVHISPTPTRNDLGGSGSFHDLVRNPPVSNPRTSPLVHPDLPHTSLLFDNATYPLNYASHCAYLLYRKGHYGHPQLV